MGKVHLNKIREEVLDEDLQYCVRRPFMKKFSGKRILVIGASGMIGSYLIRVLADYYKGDKFKGNVIGLCRNKAKLENALGSAYNESLFTYGDVCNQEIVFPKCDIVIFAAGETDYRVVSEKPDQIYSVNTTGLHNALKAALDKDVKRFVFLSSAAVYGSDNKELLEENYTGICDFNNPSQVYGQSKRMAECICKCFSLQFGMDIRIVRPFHMYGPGMKIENSNYINDCINKALSGERIILNSNGEKKRNFTYLRDMICHILMVCCADERNIIINLGSPGNNIRIKDSTQIIGKAFGVNVEYGTAKTTNPTNIRDMCPDLSKQLELQNLYDRDTKDLVFEDGIKRTNMYYVGG